MKKRCISFLLAAILLLSLLPAAMAEEEPAQPEIDIAALTEHINSGNSIALTSEIKSKTELKSTLVNAKRTAENGFNEIIPNITEDGRGIVFGKTVDIHYSTLNYGIPNQYFFCIIYYGTELKESDYIGECTEYYGDEELYVTNRILEWNTAQLNKGIGKYTIVFFTAYELNGAIEIAEPTVNCITVELCKEPIPLKRIYFADLDDKEVNQVTASMYQTDYYYIACEPKNATCDRYSIYGLADSDERLFFRESFFGFLEVTPLFPGVHILQVPFEGKTAKMTVTTPEPKGSCGPNVSWSFDSKNDALNIYDTGDMYGYEAGKQPWAKFAHYFKQINIGEGVTLIGLNAFRGCSNLQRVSIAGSVKKIASSAFSDCTALTKVILPKKLTQIDANAFSGCNELTQVIIPANVTSIGDSAFTGDKLKEVYCMGDAPNVNGAPFGAVSADRNVVVYYNEGAEGWTTPTWKGYPTKPCNPNYPPLFNDVYRSDWFYNSVRYATEHKLMGGTDVAIFDPEGSMTRAMLVTVLWRYAGSPAEGDNTFVDVPAGQWYTQAVAWAAENGIVGGVGKGKFDPEGEITREQMATILYRYAEKQEIDVSRRGDLSGYPDGGKVSDWALKEMQWAVSEGLIGGSDGYLLPQGSATRAQVATIFMRFIENIVKKN